LRSELSPERRDPNRTYKYLDPNIHEKYGERSERDEDPSYLH
jgi:hypothetical protein